MQKGGTKMKRLLNHKNRWIAMLLIMTLLVTATKTTLLQVVAENEEEITQTVTEQVETDSQDSLIDTEELTTEESTTEEPTTEEATTEEPMTEEPTTEEPTTEEATTEEPTTEGNETEVEGIVIETTAEEETAEQETADEDATEDDSAVVIVASTQSTEIAIDETDEVSTIDATDEASTIDATDEVSTVDETAAIATTYTTDDGITYNLGNYLIKLPDEDTNATYDVHIHIIRYDTNGDYLYGMADEVYRVTITDADGEVTSANYVFAYAYNNDHEHPELAVNLENITAGSTILVESIVAEKIEYDAWGGLLWTNYYDTRVGVEVVEDGNTESVVTTNEANPLQLLVGETVTHTFSIEEISNTRETEETFLTTGGTYSLLYLMDNYNVVSYDDIESTHIVGPIIAQESAYRPTDDVTGETDPTGALVASDYSRSISSYVGSPTYYMSGETALSSFQLNYDFDRDHEDESDPFVAPYFYTTLTDLKMASVTIHDDVTDYFTVDETTFVSPNDYGKQLTYQNDEFIDFEKLWDAINETSDYILENGTIEDEPIDDSLIYTYDDTDYTEGDASSIKIYQGDELLTGGDLYTETGEPRVEYTDTGEVQLNINAGESWTIEVADHLDIVNIIYPDGYDYFSDPYLIPTTINFECATINPTYIDISDDGVDNPVLHSQFPQTLIDGEEIAAIQGENGEFGEGGNKIIWNLPNVETNSETGENRLVTYGTSQNILGHIIAPNAEFWNYGVNTDGSLFWEGGNINGSVIVKDFHSGVAEMHMWPYDGGSESAVYYYVEALKTVDGGDPSRAYEFELTYVPEADGSKPDGVMNISFPITAQSNIDSDEGDLGEIDFTLLAFAEEGTYSFIVKETVPEGTVTDNIIYDLTEYQIDITVDYDEVHGKYTITGVNTYKIVDSDGNTLDTPVLVSSEIGYEFGFNNLTGEETDLVNVSLTKVSTYGNLLSGARFYVTEMTSETDVSRPSGGYLESVVSQSDGSINITGLSRDTYYAITEYEAPAGHVVSDGYWVIYIDSKGFLASITGVDGAMLSDNDELINVSEEQEFLEITLNKSNQMADILTDVEFRVQRVVLEDGIPDVVVNGYDMTYISDENGEIHITDLEADHIYMITETSTPEGHEEYTGYWLIYVTGDSTHSLIPTGYTIEEYDKDYKLVGTVTNDTLMNVKIEFILPETGGFGTTVFYVVGSMLMLIASIYYRKTRKGIISTNKAKQ